MFGSKLGLCAMSHLKSSYISSLIPGTEPLYGDSSIEPTSHRDESALSACCVVFRSCFSRTSCRPPIRSTNTSAYKERLSKSFCLSLLYRKIFQPHQSWLQLPTKIFLKGNSQLRRARGKGTGRRRISRSLRSSPSSSLPSSSHYFYYYYLADHKRRSLRTASQTKQDF